MGRGREEQLELSLGKQIGIIYNLSDVKATTKTMLQKEAAKTFKQLNAHTHAQSICVWERERDRHAHMVKNEAQSSHRNAWKITWKCQRIKSRNRFTKYKQLACPEARRRSSQRESDKVSKERGRQREWEREREWSNGYAASCLCGGCVRRVLQIKHFKWKYIKLTQLKLTFPLLPALPSHTSSCEHCATYLKSAQTHRAHLACRCNLHFSFIFIYQLRNLLPACPLLSLSLSRSPLSLPPSRSFCALPVSVIFVFLFLWQAIN